MAHSNTAKFVKRLTGKTPIEDALQKLDKLTQDEALMVSANNLEIVHGINKKVDVIEEGARNVFDSSRMEG
jgi:hypothetical protein